MADRAAVLSLTANLIADLFLEGGRSGDPLTPHFADRGSEGWRVVYGDGSWRFIQSFEVKVAQRVGGDGELSAVYRLARAYKRLELERSVGRSG